MAARPRAAERDRARQELRERCATLSSPVPRPQRTTVLSPRGGSGDGASEAQTWSSSTGIRLPASQAQDPEDKDLDMSVLHDEFRRVLQALDAVGGAAGAAPALALEPEPEPPAHEHVCSEGGDDGDEEAGGGGSVVADTERGEGKPVGLGTAPPWEDRLMDWGGYLTVP
jgi:hypothetical protein